MTQSDESLDFAALLERTLRYWPETVDAPPLQ